MHPCIYFDIPERYSKAEESLSVAVLSSVCQDVLNDASLSMFKVSSSKKNVLIQNIHIYGDPA